MIPLGYCYLVPPAVEGDSEPIIAQAAPRVESRPGCARAVGDPLGVVLVHESTRCSEVEVNSQLIADNAALCREVRRRHRPRGGRRCAQGCWPGNAAATTVKLLMHTGQGGLSSEAGMDRSTGRLLVSSSGRRGTQARSTTARRRCAAGIYGAIITAAIIAAVGGQLRWCRGGRVLVMLLAAPGRRGVR